MCELSFVSIWLFVLKPGKKPASLRQNQQPDHLGFSSDQEQSHSLESPIERPNARLITMGPQEIARCMQAEYLGDQHPEVTELFSFALHTAGVSRNSKLLDIIRYRTPRGDYYLARHAWKVPNATSNTGAFSSTVIRSTLIGFQSTSSLHLQFPEFRAGRKTEYDIKQAYPITRFLLRLFRFTKWEQTVLTSPESSVQMIVTAPRINDIRHLLTDEVQDHFFRMAFWNHICVDGRCIVTSLPYETVQTRTSAQDQGRSFGEWPRLLREFHLFVSTLIESQLRHEPGGSQLSSDSNSPPF